MKKLVMLSIVACLALSAFVLKTDNSGLKIGDKAPMTDVKMKNISNKAVSLNDVKGANGTLVVFSCNTCPFVLAWEDRYNDVYDVASKNKIGMILVNSNEAKRGDADSQAEMQRHAKAKGYKMNYVIDEGHKLADAFGARTTPHVFLFNNKGELAYVGAIDDNSADKNAVKDAYLKKALAELGSGKTSCSNAQTKAVGCSIKRVAMK